MTAVVDLDVCISTWGVSVVFLFSFPVWVKAASEGELVVGFWLLGLVMVASFLYSQGGISLLSSSRMSCQILFVFI